VRDAGSLAASTACYPVISTETVLTHLRRPPSPRLSAKRLGQPWTTHGGVHRLGRPAAGSPNWPGTRSCCLLPSEVARSCLAKHGPPDDTPAALSCCSRRAATRIASATLSVAITHAGAADTLCPCPLGPLTFPPIWSTTRPPSPTPASHRHRLLLLPRSLSSSPASDTIFLPPSPLAAHRSLPLPLPFHRHPFCPPVPL